MDIIAGILELIGLWKIGDKNKFGFIFNVICCCCWISYVFISKSAYGLLIIVVPALILNVRNFILWGK